MKPDRFAITEPILCMLPARRFPGRAVTQTVKNPAAMTEGSASGWRNYPDVPALLPFLLPPPAAPHHFPPYSPP